MHSIRASSTDFSASSLYHPVHTIQRLIGAVEPKAGRNECNTRLICQSYDHLDTAEPERSQPVAAHLRRHFHGPAIDEKTQKVVSCDVAWTVQLRKHRRDVLLCQYDDTDG
jgi:hypothetical protein